MNGAAAPSGLRVDYSFLDKFLPPSVSKLTMGGELPAGNTLHYGNEPTGGMRNIHKVRGLGSAKLSKDQLAVADMVVKAGLNNGLSLEQSIYMAAEVGRENSFKKFLNQNGHLDVGNSKKNAGMLSWQKDRYDNLINYLGSHGGLDKEGKIKLDQKTFDLQVSFMLQEMQTKPYSYMQNVFVNNSDPSDHQQVVDGFKKYLGWGNTKTDKTVNSTGASNRDTMFNALVDRYGHQAPFWEASSSSGGDAYVGFDMTKQYDYLTYVFGGKGLKGGIDCSGWTSQVAKKEAEVINRQLGSQKYGATPYGSGEQVRRFAEQNGVVTDTRDKGGFDISQLKAGMVIGQMKHSANYQGSSVHIAGYGKTQYNHVAKVVKGRDGKMYISESQGGSRKSQTGVTLTPVDKWVASKARRGDTLTAVNPYGSDIHFLN